MNRKGYTLIELIVVIALVVTVGTFGAVGLSKVISNSKEQRYNEMIDDIKSAANTYFTIYSEYDDYSCLKSKLYSGAKEVEISIETLKDALLVKENLKNPKDNTNVNGCVKITYDTEVKYEVYLNETSCSNVDEIFSCNS